MTKSKRLDRFAIAAALQEIAALLELKGGKDRFKARAYQAGARAIAGLSEDVGEVILANRLTSIPGIGGSLALQIEQLYLTGASSVLNGLKQEFPQGMLELSALPGLSVTKIRTLHAELGISSIADLKAAAEAGKIKGIQGFGAKTEQKILQTISDSRQRGKSNRILLHRALEAATQIADYLKTNRDVLEVSFAGSLRRWKETVGTIRLVANTKQPATLITHFLRYPQIAEVTEKMEEACTVRFAEGVRVSLVAARPEEFALALLTETGSKKHIDKLQQIANGQGPRANDRKPKKRAKRTRRQNGRSSELQNEEDIYEQLGMQYIPPELREDEGEIEAALAEKLPEDLVSLEDIRGMVHCHTTYSDGKHSLEEMVRAAEAMGMKYITITDHSPTAFYANGVKLDRLKRQWAEIDKIQEQVKIKILRGTESDIVADGRLDYPDKILEKFDVIVASIHSRYQMDSAKMTKRIVTAMQQPMFKIWGHALGRKLLTRPPFECDVEQILDVIAESRAAIEVNGDPNRLDMEPRWIREARKRKIKFVISVDAHSTGAFHYLKYGVATARRGWLRKSQVLNTLGVSAFQKAVKPT
ncbi:MAG TPA: DNA polymerase/3'-5' exonuclease PolX [Pyrinomonadaceae bacterium]|jgi:DNA polymerase (family 10)|nr:DNA polymerase/3'-5' exonuclease PolX [Pyrinomonadaceae bacterium]